MQAMKVLPSFNIYKRKSIANLDHKLLLKILSYVPNRREAALVNKAFYGAVCEADFKDEVHKLVFDGTIDIHDLDALTASMKNSKRRVTEIEVQGIYISDVIYEFFIRLFAKFGSFAKKLHIHRIVLEDTRMCAILSMCRNIEELTLTKSRLNRGQIDPLFNFNLKNLKKLNLSETYSYDPQPGQRRHSFIEEFMKMVVRGSQIEQLQADCNFLQKFNFEKRKLKSLAIQKVKPSNMRISTVVCSQYCLYSLDLMSSYFMDDVLMEIKRDLPDLKILKIALIGVTCNTFMEVIPEMKKLLELHINTGSAHWLPVAISGNMMPNIETLFLDMTDLFTMTQGLFQIIFEAFPSVEKLHIITNYTSCISAIFKGRIQMPLRVCTIEFKNLQQESPKALSPKLIRRDIKLKELKIINSEGAFAKKADFSFLSYFVSLEKLVINGFILNARYHQYALMLPSLVHLELAEFGVGSDYIIDENTEKMINDNRSLNLMKIECEKAILSSTATGKKFPLIYRRGADQIFRQR